MESSTVDVSPLLSVLAICCLYGRLLFILLVPLTVIFRWQKTTLVLLFAFFSCSLLMGGANAPVILLSVNAIGALICLGFFIWMGIQKLLGTNG